MFQNGLIMQWGITNPNNYILENVVFPIAFPHKCFSITVSPLKGGTYSGGVDPSIICLVYDVTKSSFVILHGDIQEVDNPQWNWTSHDQHQYTTYWYAIGY